MRGFAGGYGGSNGHYHSGGQPMATSDDGNPSAGDPLEDDRARLRKAGYSKDRIDKFLRPETPPSLPPSQTAGNFAGQQMPMSGALGNLNAAVGYARGVIPAVQNEIVTARDKDAPASRRAIAVGALALIAVVVGLIGYGVSLELSILQSQSQKAAADARVAEELADAQAAKLKAEADAAKIINDAQAQKATSEAVQAASNAYYNCVNIAITHGSSSEADLQHCYKYAAEPAELTRQDVKPKVVKCPKGQDRFGDVCKEAY